MEKEAVKAINALRQWKQSMQILGSELVGQVDPSTGKEQINGDEEVAEAVDNLITVIDKRIEEIKVKGYVPKKKFRK